MKEEERVQETGAGKLPNITVPISAAVPVAPNKKFLVYPSGSYGVSGSQQPQNTNFDQNLPIGAL